MVESTDTTSSSNRIEWTETEKEFENMKLKPGLYKGICEYGFLKLSIIQQRAIPAFLKGKNLLVQSVASSGKTAGYIIPVLQMIDEQNPDCQALVLVPGKGILKATADAFKNIAKYLEISVAAYIEEPFVKQSVSDIKEGPQVVIGTPDKVIDMQKQGYLCTDNLKMVILDEADELLSKSLIDQIIEIFQLMPPGIQVGFFSVTMPAEIQELARKVMKEPVVLQYKIEELTLEGIKQYYLTIDKEGWKFETLIELYNFIDIPQIIIYCNTSKRVEELSTKIMVERIKACMISDNMDSDSREQVLKDFRTGSARILITTDGMIKTNKIYANVESPRVIYLLNNQNF